MATVMSSARLLWILSVFLTVVMVTAQDIKPGQCPGPDRVSNNTCEHQCAGDADCSGEKICCFNGCYVGDCMDPVDALPDYTENRYEILACEGNNVHFVCPSGYHIKIMAAFWGRGHDRHCQTGNPNDVAETCSMSDVTTVIRNECENLATCRIPAFTGYLGEPCQELTHKYLKAEYYCEENLEVSLMCEGQGLRSVGCANAQVINVRSAFWGRGNDPEICPHQSVTGAEEECSQENAYLIFREMCNGRSKCDFEAVRSVWGDICPDLHKFLYLTYNCVDCVNIHYSDLECEMWSLEGECGGANYDWMSLNCRKTCERCSDYAPDIVNYHSNNTECDIWADRGECRTSPAFMLTYCRESCIAPVTRTSCARNRHDEYINLWDCQVWADDGQCQKNNHYMFWDCTKSCFGCHDDDKIRCSNKYFNESACELWAANGDCDTDPGWMIPNCFKTCMRCDADPVCKNEANDTICDYWESIGECETNAVWMHQNCWKSCIVCDDAEDEVTDCSNNHWDDSRDSDNCDARYEQGLCSTNSSTMLTECTRSCFDCESDDLVRCVNKASESDCDRWADEGQCEINPGYMIPNCLKSCIGCEADPVCNNVEDDANCEYWASIGECETNPRFMYQSCWSSCIKCDVDLKCVNMNHDNDCEYWIRFGGCSSSNHLQPRVMDFCAASCTKCDPAYLGLPGCRDSFADCPYWSSIDQCAQNPIWMVHYCRASCTHCDLVDSSNTTSTSTTTTTTTSPAPQTTTTTTTQRPHTDMPRTTTTTTTEPPTRPTTTTTTTPEPPTSTTTTSTTTTTSPHTDLPRTTTMTTPEPPTTRRTTTTTTTEPPTTRPTTTTTTTPEPPTSTTTTSTTTTTSPHTETTTTPDPPTTRPTTTTTTTRPTTTTTTPTTTTTRATTTTTTSATTTTVTQERRTNGPIDGEVSTSGSDVRSGDWFSATNVFTRRKTFVTPLRVSTTGVIRSFIPRLVASTSVNLEIWRENVTTALSSHKYFERIFSLTVQYAANPSEAVTPDVTVNDCVEVRAGDRIGFTSMSSPAPLDFKRFTGDSTERTYFRNAGNDMGSFLSMVYGFEFGLAVNVEAGATC